MKVLPSYIHGVVDYLLGIAFILMPTMLFTGGMAGAANLSRVIGIVLLVQAVITNYELGLFRVLSFNTHLKLDYFWGIFIAVCPWLFGFAAAESMRNLFLTLGVAAFLVTLLTEPYVRLSRTPASAHRS